MIRWKDRVAKLIEWLLKLAAPILLATLLAWENQLSQWLDTAPSIWRFRLLAGLLFLSLGLTTWLYLSRPKLNFIKNVGAWLDVKTNTYYCHSCKSKTLLSPLLVSNGRLRCVVAGCPTFLHNPDYVEPPPKPIDRHGF